jgi:hypothetical protein
MVLHVEPDDYTITYIYPKGPSLHMFGLTLSALHEAYAYARLGNLALGPLRRRSKPSEQAIGQ